MLAADRPRSRPPRIGVSPRKMTECSLVCSSKTHRCRPRHHHTAYQLHRARAPGRSTQLATGGGAAVVHNMSALNIKRVIAKVDVARSHPCGISLHWQPGHLGLQNGRRQPWKSPPLLGDVGSVLMEPSAPEWVCIYAEDNRDATLGAVVHI